MFKDKVFASFAEAVADIPDGATIMMTGFGSPRAWPQRLTLALRDHGVKNLTMICSNMGMPAPTTPGPGEVFATTEILIENKQVKKGIADIFFTGIDAKTFFQEAYYAGELEIECIPYGNFIERIRSGGAGMGPFYTPVGVNTIFGKGKEKRIFNGKKYMLEFPLRGDYAFIKAHKADKMGNLVYKGTSRCKGPEMAKACDIVIAEVDEIVENGELDPESIVTSGIWVDRIVKITEPGLYPKDTRLLKGKTA